jgi:hypothetical protein
MGQSRKTQVIAVSLNRTMRLIARARSYRVQIKGAPKSTLHMHGHGYAPTIIWHDIQVIPRTHQREDISHELNAAVSALTRRIHEYEALDHSIVNKVLSNSPYKGLQLWNAIRLAICNEINHCHLAKSAALGAMYGSKIIENMVQHISRANRGPFPGSIKILGHDTWNDEVIYAQSGTSKEGSATQYPRRQRNHDRKSKRLWQKHHAYGRFRDAPDPERKARQDNRVRDYLRRNSDASRFDWLTVERGKDVFVAGAITRWPDDCYIHGNGPELPLMDVGRIHR